jgi:hypothetical protein
MTSSELACKRVLQLFCVAFVGCTVVLLISPPLEERLNKQKQEQQNETIEEAPKGRDALQENDGPQIVYPVLHSIDPATAVGPSPSDGGTGLSSLGVNYDER